MTDVGPQVENLDIADYAKGFGGKYGVQKDRQDDAALGWDHHEKVEKHASQKGNHSEPALAL